MNLEQKEIALSFESPKVRSRDGQYAFPKPIIKTLSLCSLSSSWLALTLTTSNSCGEVTPAFREIDKQKHRMTDYSAVR